MLEIYDKVQEAAQAIRRAWPHVPRVGIILGTGLGSLVDEIDVQASLDYEQIPHFLRPTAVGHRGRLVAGSLAGVPVVAMDGRFHLYEGYSLRDVTLPVRVMKALGAEVLIVSNACGGMNPYYRLGDLVVIDDHLNLMGDNPLIGINDDRLGPRFPDMSQPYDPELLERVLQIGRREDLVIHRGVFAAVAGPNLETRAEYRYLRTMGADTVGMSTVPEVIVAVHCGLRVVGLSIVTDLCFPDALEPADVQQIIATAQQAEPRLRLVVTRLVEGLEGSAG